MKSIFFFFSSRRRHTRSLRDWSSDVCSSDLAHQGERRDLQRDRGRPGPLAHHDVDPEVLHREVEHLLGGPRHPVDLVDEHHLALAQGGERSEERRVGKECRTRWSAYHEKKKK